MKSILAVDYHLLAIYCVFPVRSTYSATYASPTQLAWRHWGWHWLIGLALLLGALILRGKIRGMDTAHALLESIFYGFSLGIPAAVVGLLRVPAMKSLFARVQAQPKKWSSIRLIAWTASIYLMPVVLVAGVVGFSFVADQKPGDSMATSTFLLVLYVSLPWLLGSVIMAFRLLHQIYPGEEIVGVD